MDEHEFKSTYAEYNELPCAFAKAVLIRCAACSSAQRIYIAEREAVACLSPTGHRRCSAMLGTLRDKALFALRQTQPEQRLPHAKEVKVECGGLGALHTTLGLEGERVDDIHTLLAAAETRFGSVEALPYPALMSAISHYQLRKRAKGRR